MIPHLRSISGRWHCSLMDGIYPRPPIGRGINEYEAYAEWKHLARLQGVL